MEEHKKLDMALHSQRSEEVAHIIERMPTRFGLAISGIILLLFALMGIFGWISRYPDIATGQIVVNASSSPIKLVANANGKLKLAGMASQSAVKEGELVAYIENSTTPKAVNQVVQLLQKANPMQMDIVQLHRLLPKNVSLGELNIKYYTYLSAVQQYWNYKQDGAYGKQKSNLSAIYNEQQKSIKTAGMQLAMAKNSLAYVHKFYTRDSTLFKKRVISEAELDQTEMNYLAGKDRVQQAINALSQAKQALKQTQNSLDQVGVEDPEKEKELKIGLISAYNDLLDNIKLWEQKYVFKAPFDGKVQFLKFYAENQFVQAGEQLMTIVPAENKPYGQVILPAQGAGKVKIGQEVIVKLNDYPYMEYGSVTGRVKSISLTTNTEKTQQGDLETYLITVDFPQGLKTNYGSMLAFRYETKGTAEVITKDRRLVERLFDNLKYAVKK